MNREGGTEGGRGGGERRKSEIKNEEKVCHTLQEKVKDENEEDGWRRKGEGKYKRKRKGREDIKD